MKFLDKIISAKGKLFEKVITIFSSIFLLFFVIIILFYSYQQIRSVKISFIREGKVLTNVLSVNSTLGIISRSKKLLKQEAQGFLKLPNVLGILVYADNSLILKIKKRKFIENIASLPEVQKRLRTNKDNPPYVYESTDIIEIWAPVYATVKFKSPDQIILGIIPKEKRLIGWITLYLDKTEIIRKKRTYLLLSIFLFFFLFTIAYMFIYRAAFKTVGSLDELCEFVDRIKNVKDIDSLQEIPISGKDEAGRIAALINDMIRNLKAGLEEKKKLEQQLLNSQKLEAIGALAGGIAHDFNNVLASIMGSGDIVKYKMIKGDEVDPRSIEVIITACKRAREMIVELLRYARGKKMDRYPLKLNEQIILLKKIISGMLSDDIEVKIELSKDDPVVVSNATQLHQVLLNMVTNAQDAMPKGGTLRIATDIVEISEDVARKKGDWVNPGKYGVIYIQDTGIGIDPEAKKNLFKPFFTTKAQEKGTGLGLYNCFKIIREHGGFIDVESEEGKGTTFKIYIPLSEKKEAVKEEEEISLSKIPAGSGTILVADDEPLVREVIKSILIEFGYKVILASNGIDAVNKFRENMDKIDLVLVDIVMPYKHGKAVHNEIKKMKPDVKILFMSGYPDYVLSEKGISTDDIEYLPKPIRAADLIKRIQKMLNS